MTTSVHRPRSRLEALDSVRGLAALVVVLHHLAHAFWPAALASCSPLRSALDGSFAVTIFFVLSGLVLSVAYFERPALDLLAAAAARRYFRLTPPILVSVLVDYLLLSAGAFANDAAADMLGREPGQWLRHSFRFTPDVRDALGEGLYRVYLRHDPARSYNAVLWTMSVELEGSLFVFAFLALAGRLRRRELVYLAVAAALLLRSHYMLDFLVGVMLAELHVRSSHGRQPGACSSVGGTALLAVGVFIGSALPGWFGDRLGLGLLPHRLECQTLGAACLIWASVACPFWRGLLVARWLRWLGRISFPLYLIHYLVICSVGCGVFLALCTRGWAIDSAAWASAVAVVAVSVGAAWAMTETVDRWSIALARWVGERFRGQRKGGERPSGAEASDDRVAPEIRTWRYTQGVPTGGRLGVAARDTVVAAERSEP